MGRMLLALLFVFGVCGIAGTAALYAQEITKPIYSVKTTEKVVALTFDDGPDANTLKLLELFEAEGVKATFFITGARLEKSPEIARKTLEKGHEIGNHSISHAVLPSLTPEKVQEEIAGMQERIQKTLGIEAKIFRAPNLRYDDKVWKVLSELSLPAINATVSTSDWNKEVTAEQVYKTATTDIKPGSIILMHSWPGKTLEVMPRIISDLKEQGFRFVTVSELLALGGK